MERGHGRIGRRMVAAMVAALSIGAGLASPAASAEPTELPGGMIAAAVADLDGDGAREVVRMVHSGDAVLVDAWRHDGGGWTGIRGAELLDEQDLGGLVRMTHDGRDRLIALRAAGTPGDPFGPVCCLSIIQVREVDGAISLVPIEIDDLDRRARFVQALDIDADGTDELLTMRETFDGQGIPERTFLELLAWRDGRYVQLAELGPTDGGRALVKGETDGRPGDDLLLGPDHRGSIQRLAFVDGAPRLEEAHLDVLQRGGEYYGYISGIADGVIVISDQTGVRAVTWPPGGDLREVASRQGFGEFPWITAAGSGDDTLIVRVQNASTTGETVGLTVLDRDLRPIGQVSQSASSEAIWRFLDAGINTAGPEISPYPFTGLLPSGVLGDGLSFAAAGVLVAPDGNGSFETRPISPLAGLVPFGLAGRDNALLAASSGGAWFGPPDAAYLSPIAAVAAPLGRLVIIPVEVLLQPSASTAASVELDGAVLTADQHLLARPDGFAAVVHAPAGTLVLAGGSTLESYDVGADPLTVDFVPPRNEGAGDFEFSVLAVLPDGRVLIEEWVGTVVADAPALDATSATTPFALRAEIRGTAEPYVQLRVDGRPVHVSADGSFELVVDVPPWPRDVVVAARDPFGNEASLRVQAIGFLDYRGLPWIPIAGLATVLVGAYVFLRVPRPPAERVAQLSDDAALEEIEAD